jgi:hypothetical protein
MNGSSRKADAASPVDNNHPSQATMVTEMNRCLKVELHLLRVDNVMRRLRGPDREGY